MNVTVFLNGSKMNGLRIKIRAKMKMTRNTLYVTTLKMNMETEKTTRRGSVIGARNIASRW